MTPTRTLIPLLCLTLTACAQRAATTRADAPASQPAQAMSHASDKAQMNPLLAPYAGAYGGVPAFDQMRIEDLKPAFEQAAAEYLAEVDAIAKSSEPPTFENTIVAYDKAGPALDRLFTYWGIWRSNLSTPEFRAIHKELVPKVSELESKVIQNAALFARIRAVYEGEEMKGLRPDQKRATRLIYERFAHDGATLEGEAKERYAEINKRLAALHTQFSTNVLADEEGYVTYLKADQLGGLSESFTKAAAAAAEERGRKGEYAITNTRSSMDPFLTFSTERALREKVWRNYYSRGDNGDDHDNNKVIAEILALRHERVKLLGYENYASWRLENRMAKSPERASELVMAVWPAAIARVREEVADMQAIADKEGAGIKIAPWDYRFYAEKVRKAKYDLDSDEVKQYLQLEKLREAMFFVAGELFDFVFEPVSEPVPVFHEDVRVWQVKRKSSGADVGLWYLDPYARTGKQSGAWATSYRRHHKQQKIHTVLASNNSNFVEGPEGSAVLISWDDARTLFHEFGHALHSLSSQVEYPILNSGVRDYTEFQSQLLERWLATDPVIEKYLVHHETGAPMPAELVAKIKKAATFNNGFQTTEYLASAILDLKYHTMDPTGLDPDAFERETLEALNMPEEIVMRHRSPHFGHVFSGEGYAAAYYGYMWADVLTADAAEAFTAAPGGFYDKALAAKLVEHLFAVGNAVEPGEAYRAFRGRDAQMEALMRDRGFPVPEK